MSYSAVLQPCVLKTYTNVKDKNNAEIVTLGPYLLINTQSSNASIIEIYINDDPVNSLKFLCSINFIKGLTIKHITLGLVQDDYFILAVVSIDFKCYVWSTLLPKYFFSNSLSNGTWIPINLNVEVDILTVALSSHTLPCTYSQNSPVCNNTSYTLSDCSSVNSDQLSVNCSDAICAYEISILFITTLNNFFTVSSVRVALMLDNALLQVRQLFQISSQSFDANVTIFVCFYQAGDFKCAIFKIIDKFDVPYINIYTIGKSQHRNPFNFNMTYTVIENESFAVITRPGNRLWVSNLKGEVVSTLKFQVDTEFEVIESIEGTPYILAWDTQSNITVINLKLVSLQKLDPKYCITLDSLKYDTINDLSVNTYDSCTGSSSVKDGFSNTKEYNQAKSKIIYNRVSKQFFKLFSSYIISEKIYLHLTEAFAILLPKTIENDFLWDTIKVMDDLLEKGTINCMSSGKHICIDWLNKLMSESLLNEEKINIIQSLKSKINCSVHTENSYYQNHDLEAILPKAQVIIPLDSERIDSLPCNEESSRIHKVEHPSDTSDIISTAAEMGIWEYELKLKSKPVFEIQFGNILLKDIVEGFYTSNKIRNTKIKLSSKESIIDPKPTQYFWKYFKNNPTKNSINYTVATCKKQYVADIELIYNDLINKVKSLDVIIKSNIHIIPFEEPKLSCFRNSHLSNYSTTFGNTKNKFDEATNQKASSCSHNDEPGTSLSPNDCKSDIIAKLINSDASPKTIHPADSCYSKAEDSPNTILTNEIQSAEMIRSIHNSQLECESQIKNLLESKHLESSCSELYDKLEGVRLSSNTSREPKINQTTVGKDEVHNDTTNLQIYSTQPNIEMPYNIKYLYSRENNLTLWNINDALKFVNITRSCFHSFYDLSIRYSWLQGMLLNYIYSNSTVSNNKMRSFRRRLIEFYKLRHNPSYVFYPMITCTSFADLTHTQLNPTNDLSIPEDTILMQLTKMYKDFEIPQKFDVDLSDLCSIKRLKKLIIFCIYQVKPLLKKYNFIIYKRVIKLCQSSHPIYLSNASLIATYILMNQSSYIKLETIITLIAVNEKTKLKISKFIEKYFPSVSLGSLYLILCALWCNRSMHCNLHTLYLTSYVSAITHLLLYNCKSSFFNIIEAQSKQVFNTVQSYFVKSKRRLR